MPDAGGHGGGPDSHDVLQHAGGSRPEGQRLDGRAGERADERGGGRARVPDVPGEDVLIASREARDVDIHGHRRSREAPVPFYPDVAPAGLTDGGTRRGVCAVETAHAGGHPEVGREDQLRSAAVVVHAVAHDFGSPGVDSGVAVVAVGVVGHVPARSAARGGGHRRVAVRVAVAVAVVGSGQTVIHAAVAVVVEAVANFGVPGEFGGVAVVAVPATGIDAVAVAVVDIDDAVAVVVLAIAPLGIARVDIVVRVIAVGVVRGVAGRLTAGQDADGSVAVAIVVAVREPGERIHGAFIDGAFTVVVFAVARLHRRGVDGPVGVVAVGVDRAVAGAGIGALGGPAARPVPIAVRVGVVDGDREVLVRTAVAVVVHVVADLCGSRVDGGGGVVAVGGVGHVANGLVAGEGGGIRIAVRVSIEILVPSELVRGVFVDGVFAIVVHPVAHFRVTGVGVCVGVVAVLARGNQVTVGIRVAERAVAVEIFHRRAVLVRVRMDGGIRVVAVGVVFDVPGGSRTVVHDHRRVAVAVAVRVRVVRGLVRRIGVDDVVTVVVHAVADLRGIRIDRRVVVVAIVVGVETVAVRIGGLSSGVCVRIGLIDLTRIRFTGLGVRVWNRVAGVSGIHHRVASIGLAAVEHDRGCSEEAITRLRAVARGQIAASEHEGENARNSDGGDGRKAVADDREDRGDEGTEAETIHEVISWDR